MAAAERISNGAARAYRALLSFFEKFYPVFFAAALLVLAFYCFRCLDVQYVDSWDEARHGVNAYEMDMTGDYIVHTYNYETDYWNLKPSLSYWLILLGFRIFGYSVMGLRFGSALCYLLTGALCALFVKRRYSEEASILVLFFFCANERPLSAHLARAGDADALFMLLFTAAILATFLIHENHRFLYVLGLSFSLAFLTKSWHAFMIAAVAGLYLLISGELFKQTLKRWLLFLASVFAPLAAWFGWRFTKDGFSFLRQMLEVDLLARTTSEGYEGHQYPFSFYWEYVFGDGDFIYRWLILICVIAVISAVIVLTKKRMWSAYRRDVCDGAGFLLWFAVPFLGFSLIGTKLIWYCYPCTVPLIMFSAVILGWVFRRPLAVSENADARKGGPARVIMPWACMLAVAGSVVITVFFMWNAYVNVIRDAHGDAFQLFIAESADRDSEYAGLTAYVYVAGEDADEIGCWDQNMLFVAEISGDFHCEDGGVEAFLADEGASVLYISASEYLDYEPVLEGAGILYENGSYLLLGAGL